MRLCVTWMFLTPCPRKVGSLCEICLSGDKMPNPNDSKKFSWPKDGTQDQAWFKSRVDTFPNGTRLVKYDEKLMRNSIKYSLDKICKSQDKCKK